LTNKKNDKGWPTKVGSHGMDEHHEGKDLDVDAAEFMDSPKKLAAKIISSLKSKTAAKAADSEESKQRKSPT
jgi:hypothetical protein